MFQIGSVVSCQPVQPSQPVQPVHGGSDSHWVTAQPCQPCQPVRFRRVVSTGSASQPVQPVVLTAPPISPVLLVLPVNSAHPARRSHSSCPSRASHLFRLPCPFFAFCHHGPPAHSAFAAAPVFDFEGSSCPGMSSWMAQRPMDGEPGPGQLLFQNQRFLDKNL